MRGVVLLWVLGGAGVAVAAWYAWRREQQRRQVIMTFARGKGWAYRSRDDALADRWTGPPFGEGSRRRTANVLDGRWAELPMTAFDYSYQTQSSDGRGNTTTQTHRFAVCVLHLPGWLPSLSVVPETLFSRIGNLLTGDDIELESEDFNRRFRVRAGDRRFASDVLTPRTMELLLARRPLRWRVSGADIICWDDGELTVPRLLEAAATLADVVAGIPSFVWKDATRGGNA